MKESAIERKVVAYCREQGMLCYKFTSPARRGVPDRLILYRGKVLFLELKATGKKLGTLQKYEMEILRGAGFQAAWCDSFTEAKRLLDTFRSQCQNIPIDTD